MTEFHCRPRSVTGGPPRPLTTLGNVIPSAASAAQAVCGDTILAGVLAACAGHLAGASRTMQSGQTPGRTPLGEGCSPATAGSGLAKLACAPVAAGRNRRGIAKLSRNWTVRSGSADFSAKLRKAEFQGFVRGATLPRLRVDNGVYGARFLERIYLTFSMKSR